MAKNWTPGPWRVEDDTTLVWGTCSLYDNSSNGMGYPISECRIARISSWAKGPDLDAGIANAHLIASAPDMYDLIEEFKKFLEPMRFDRASDNDVAIRLDIAAHHILAKARGEQ